jgi:hypothetical protein
LKEFSGGIEMGNILNDLLYKLGIGRKNAEVFVLTQNNRLKRQYKEVSKDRTLVFKHGKLDAIKENPKVTGMPLRDDSTNRPCYLVIEGIPGTFDIQRFMSEQTTNQNDDLTASTMLQLGQDIERQRYLEMNWDKKLLYMMIFIGCLMVIQIVMLYTVLEAVG